MKTCKTVTAIPTFTMKTKKASKHPAMKRCGPKKYATGHIRFVTFGSMQHAFRIQ